MNRLAVVFFTIVLILMITACATHYYRVDEDMVRIYVKLDNARQVYFASSLDGYELHRANRISSRIWENIVPANRTFTYFYLVDDEVYRPSCRYKEKDDFGSENCIYIPDS